VLWAIVPAGIAAMVVSFLLLPIVLAIRVERQTEDGPFDVRLDLSPWWGVLGAVARGPENGWELGPRLFGRSIGMWFAIAQKNGGAQKSAGKDERPGATQTAESTDQTEAVDSASPPAKASIRDRIEHGISILSPLLRPAWRLLSSCPRAISLRRLQGQGWVGLADPAQTGQIQGVMYALREFLPRRIELDIASDFVRQGAGGQATLIAHLYPAKLLYYLARFGLTIGIEWVSARWTLWRGLNS
jgi:hypothetical protein